MTPSEFHPVIAQWFAERFGEPTEPQRLAWPHIRRGQPTLIAAPTGSGKTLAAFMPCIDDLFRESLAGGVGDGVQILYVSPLKALSNDVRRNLETPLAEINAAALAAGLDAPGIRAMVRTGDTPASERQKMNRRPPHILVTTPESLYLLLTSPKSRDSLRNVRTVIVDEIHALARDKRGSHLTLSLERLEALVERPPLRIGLSATQRPIEQLAAFLVGSRNGDDGKPRCEIVDAGHLRELDLAVEVPPSELSAVCSHEVWGEVYARLVELINSHRSTLVFVNTRKLAERVAHMLTELLGEEAVASHHGSLSRAIRQSAEERLKEGRLKAIVATASLEMGIDVGFIDLVCQIGSPRSIATFLQRVGRSGHSLGVVPKGRLFPLGRDELLECLALIRAVRGGRLDAVEIPRAPLDILAQQIVATVASDEWDETELFDALRRAWPYQELKREEYNEILHLLSEGISPKLQRGALLHRDVINGRLRARRGARLTAISNGGAIPDMADYRVVTAEDHTYVGTLNEDFALESNAGDVFLLGNMSWRVRQVKGLEVIVSDAQGAPATIPFWLGESPGRTVELSSELSDVRLAVEQRIHEVVQCSPVSPQCSLVSPKPGGRVSEKPADTARETAGPVSEKPDYTAEERELQDEPPSEFSLHEAIAWLQKECLAGPWAAEQAARYVAAQKAAVGLAPTRNRIVFERFFDESGGMQLVIHAPLGARINRAWGLSLRKRFCRSFDFELQASADDDGIVLSLSPQHSFPIDALFKMLGTHNGEYLLRQAVLAAPMFQTRWRWNVTRALAVSRMRAGKKVPPNLQRFRAEDLLAAVFPETVGCLENHHGDVEIPDHPLVRQTMTDCLTEVMDLPRWLEMFGEVERGEIEFLARDTREPSPFSHRLLNANPYAFLDDAPLEERRARAVATRRGLNIEAVRDLGRLDPEAIAQVRAEAWPLVRDADELHDALYTMVALPAEEGVPWAAFFNQLLRDGRASVVSRTSSPSLWIAAERWPLLQTLFPDAACRPALNLPESVRRNWETAEARVTLLRGRLQSLGPASTSKLAGDLGLEESSVEAAMQALEAEGTAMRGQFTSPPPLSASNGHASAAHANGNGAATMECVTATGSVLHPQSTVGTEWCDRRLLARIHRQTLDGLRRKIQPVEPVDYVRFLMRHQRVLPELRWRNAQGVRKAIEQLQGFEMAAAAWERGALPARVEKYEPEWLDQLSFSGELVWGRLRPPRKDEDDVPSAAGMTRAMPVSLLLRESLPWLVSPERATAEAFTRSNAGLVLQSLQARGALFQHELAAATQLLPAQLIEALHELAALGLVTADAFGAVRVLVTPSKARGGRAARLIHQQGRRAGWSSPSGRWSLFPGPFEAPTEAERLVSWVWQLLERWGVLFRDLLTRESAAPSWPQLTYTLRRMEARGEIRGGRFVSGVGGEQYALPSAVEGLRRVRDEKPNGVTIVISSADPLNLAGILTPGPRVPGTHANSLALRDGKFIAVQQAGELEFFEKLAPEAEAELSRQLRKTG